MRHRVRYEGMVGIFALPPTPARPGAQRLDAADTVDVDETERMVRQLIRDGIAGIFTNGTLGEMATLTEEEWQRFNTVVWETVRAVNPDFPLFIGATTLNTRDTVRRIRFVDKLGAPGVFVGRPFWCAMDVATMVTFYRDIAEAFPHLSFVLYDNPEAFKGPIPTAAYQQLARIPNIVAVKYTTMTPKYHRDVDVTRGHIRILPLDSDWFWAALTYPEDAVGCWSSTVLLGPEPVRYLETTLREGRLDEARWVAQRIQWAYEPFVATQNFQLFSLYNIHLEKVRMDEAGYVKAGPARRPYHTAPSALEDGARLHARRWRQLVEEVRARQEAGAAARAD